MDYDNIIFYVNDVDFLFKVLNFIFYLLHKLVLSITIKNVKKKKISFNIRIIITF